MPTTRLIIAASPHRRMHRIYRGVFGLVIAGACLASVGCAPTNALPVLTDVPFDSESWHYGDSPGTRLLTKHYDLYTTVRDENLVKSLPQALESIRQYYQSLLPAAVVSTERMPVYLFARREEWEHFTRRTFGPRAEVLLRIRNGGYVERGIAVIEYVTNSVTFPLLAHEGFHQFIHFSGEPVIPAWLNEGMSVLCEGQRWGKEGLIGFDPRLNPARRNNLADALLRDELIPLPELLRINAGDVVGTSTRKAQTYYAELWGLLQFLKDAPPEYSEGYQRLRNTVGVEDLRAYAQAAHLSSERKRYNFGRCLFEAFITKDIETAQRDFERYLRQQLLNEHE